MQLTDKFIIVKVLYFSKLIYKFCFGISHELLLFFNIKCCI